MVCILFNMLPWYDFSTLSVAEIAGPVPEDGGPPTTTEARQPGRVPSRQNAHGVNYK